MRARSGIDLVGGDRRGARILRLFAAWVLVNAILLAPSWFLAGRVGLPLLAAEALVVVGIFAALPARRWASAAALAAATGVLLVTFVGFGETGTRMALARPLNLYLDVWLLRSVWHLLIGSLGPFMAAAVVTLTPILALSVLLLVAFLLTPIRSERPALTVRLSALVLLALVSVGLTAERVPGLARYVGAPAWRLVVEQARAFRYMSGERDRFADALARYPESYSELPGLLSRLAGRDVVLGFIESYGMTALYDPRYGPVVGPRLDDLEERVRSAGLHMASGALVAPTQGGQSWFSHGSLLSGVWLDNQLRYDMLLASGRETLIDDFRRAGHNTVAVMPAITMPWPEGDRFGYDEVFVRKDIDYAGPPLNWVTMPDQFTWSYVQKRILEERAAPVFAEIGLVSSHAPWTPILTVLDDWEAIGDGAVFSRWEGAGEAPEALWLDTERVRQHYAMSLEYAVHAMAAYAERYVDGSVLLIALGDHQPAPLITGDDAPWSVPVHVISGDAALVEPFLQWGFEEGAWPDADQEPLGMDHFRDWFVRAYSGR